MKTNHSIEILEARVAPASLVAVHFNSSTGVLKITGDAGDNSINLSQTGEDTYSIQSTTDDLNFAGNHQVVIAAHVKALIIDGGKGSDIINISNFTTLGSFTLKASPGNDGVHVTNLATTGNAVFNFGNDGANVSMNGLSTQIGGNLVLNFGAGGGTFNAFDLSNSSITIDGGLKIRGGSGNEAISLTTNTLTIGNRLDFASGGGGGTLTIAAAQALIGNSTTGALRMQSGSGGAQLIVNNGDVTFDGAVKVNGGATLSLTPHTLNVNGDFVVNGSASGTSISLTSLASKFNGRVDLFLNGGSDSVSLTGNGSISFEDNLRFKTKTGGGHLSIHGAGTSFSKSLKFGSPGGVLSIQADANVTIGGNLIVLDSDSTSFSTPTVRIAGKLSVDDTNSLSFHAEQVVVGQNFSFGGGAMSFSGYNFQCGGDLNLKGVQGASISGLAIQIGGDANITFADASNAVESISISGAGSIGGDVRVHLGGSSGSHSINLSGNGSPLTVGGKLVVRSDHTAGLASEGVTLNNLTVNDAVYIALSAASSAVTIDDLRAKGTFNLDTGGGNDSVSIERGNGSGASLFEKLAVIQLGAGDDQILIGKSTTSNGGSNTANFNAGLLVLGGAGTDDSNDFVSALVNTGVVAADRVGFELEDLPNT